MVLVLAIRTAIGCGPPAAAELVQPRFESPRAEFEAIASNLETGDNLFFGARRLETARKHVTVSETSQRKISALRALAQIQLERGEIQAAHDSLEEAFAWTGAAIGDRKRANLLRTRALAHLRQAEVENCIARHNSDCCLFPLTDGGIHTSAEPARAARADYLSYLRIFPEDRGVRWLVQLAHMASGDPERQLPRRWRAPAPPRESPRAPAELSAEQPVGRFVDIAPAASVDARNLCGGAVVDDFDGDGWLDIVTSTSDAWGALIHYRNLGSNRFEDVSDESGTSDQLGGLNCLGADYDSDGDVDLLVLRGAWLFDDGRIRNSLLENDGTGHFTDVTRTAGLAEPAYPTQAAAFGDFDLDGHLDLYLGNESRLEQRGDGDFPAQLFRNLHNGSFHDEARRAGVTNDRYCKGVAAGDYDNDGDLDLYVSNIGTNRLYRNEGGLKFTDVAAALGLSLPHRTFAPWFFDYDNDGWLDLFVTSFQATLDDVAADHFGLKTDAPAPALFRNEGGTFTDIAHEAGLDHPWLPMGASFGDLDNDGWLDVYLATGDPNFETLVPNVALRNVDGQHFEDVTVSAGLGHLQKGHGVAFADLDRDGDQDLYHQLGGFYPGDRFHNALFENPGHGRRHVVLLLQGTDSVRCAYGARVRVTVAQGEETRELYRAMGSVSSFGGSPARIELGLGDAERILSVEVQWPRSGTVSHVTDVPLDAAIRIVEGRPGFERLPHGPDDPALR